MEPTAQPLSRPRAIIVRVFIDEAGILRGRIDDPATERHTSFVGADELLALVMAFVRNPPTQENNRR